MVDVEKMFQTRRFFAMFVLVSTFLLCTPTRPRGQPNKNVSDADAATPAQGALSPMGEERELESPEPGEVPNTPQAGGAPLDETAEVRSHTGPMGGYSIQSGGLITIGMP